MRETEPVRFITVFITCYKKGIIFRQGHRDTILKIKLNDAEQGRDEAHRKCQMGATLHFHNKACEIRQANA